MTATIGCENASGMEGVMVEGPDFEWPSDVSSNNGGDDLIYTFTYATNYDASILSIDLNNIVVVGDNTISGEFINYGLETITSYDLNYSIDGGATVATSVSGVSIERNEVSPFSHNTPFSVTTPGSSYDLCVWIDNLNGNADGFPSNDELCEGIVASSGIGPSEVNVLLEEFTGTWCGFCPDGGVILDELIDQYPGKVIGISIHDGDIMSFDNQIVSGFNILGFPTGMINRTVFAGEETEQHSREDWAVNTANQLNRYTPVEVDVSHTYDEVTREIAVTVTANFVDYAAGDLRLIAFITEDNVTGDEPDYDQVNYYNNSAGHPYFGAGNPIVGYNHRHVLRASLPGSIYGNPGVIPSSISAGDTYSETFTYTLPSDYDETEITLIGAVVRGVEEIGERYILNVDDQYLSTNTLSNKEVELLGGVSISPNPASNQVTIEFSPTNKIEAEILIYNSFGQIVKTVASKLYSSELQRVETSIEDLSVGIYFVTIRSEQSISTSKMIIK